jgi:hypothetical protein
MTDIEKKEPLINIKFWFGTDISKLETENERLRLRIAQLEQQLEEGEPPDKGDIDGRD